MFFMLAAKKPVAAVIATLIVIDVVVGAVLLANDFNPLPTGVKFGFYKTTEPKG